MFTANIFLRSGCSAIIASSLLFLTACGSAPPREALSQAQIAVQDAERAGASQYEPQLLSSARSKLDRAHRAVDDDENDDARRMAEEAYAEAALANAKAEAAKQARQAEEMKKAIEALKQETSR